MLVMSMSLASTFPTTPICLYIYALESGSLSAVFQSKMGIRAKGEVDSTLTHKML